MEKDMKSIKEYFEARYYDDIYDHVTDYIDSHITNLQKKAYKLKRIGEYEVSDLSISKINVYDLPEMDIQCDVLVSITIVVQDGDSHYDNEQEINLTYTLTYKGDIVVGIFVFSSIKPFWDTQNASKLSLDLVPVIKSEELDNYVDTILDRYYPEALDGREVVNPDTLVKRLGLTKVEGSIAKSRAVFGRVYFVDAEAAYYDWLDGTPQVSNVKAGTIFVDPNVYFFRNVGALNNTIIHECVHWILHRKAFELKRLLGNTEINKIECVVDGSARGAKWDALSIMEWQANAIAPKIQMPRTAFCQKADEFFAKHSEENMCDVIEPVIGELSEHFKVSKLAAKIRLVELGYDEAIGAFNYVDGHYVRPHSFKKGTLDVNQTFTLPAQDAVIERNINPELRKLTDSGDYLFVENHYVYNAPHYIQYNENGHLELTDYARSHMDECCLIFDMKITSEYGRSYHTVCYLNREDSNVTFEIKYHNGFENAPAERQIEYRMRQQAEWMNIRRQMTDDPCQCMNLLMEWRGMEYTQLADSIDISERTIRRIANGETSPKMESAVRICLGLHLPPIISEKLLDVLGCKLLPMNTEHQWIKEALTLKYPESFDAVCSWLRDYKVEL